MDFEYKINLENLDPNLRPLVVDLGPDPELKDVLENWRAHPYSKFKLLVYRILSRFVPLFTIDALLGMYPLYIFGIETWKRLVPRELIGGSLLDIGAGQGFVTMNAKGLFKEIVTTETSVGVAIRLWIKGFVCKMKDVALYPELFPKKSFDIISILNVLDRSSRPKTLLRNSIGFLKDDGYIIIATPLPIRQVVWTTVWNEADESLGLVGVGGFEECLNDLVQTVLMPLGLEPTLLARLPYVCKSDDMDNMEWFDDAIIVCKKINK
jgi:SAM-dependent methyltransferase